MGPSLKERQAKNRSTSVGRDFKSPNTSQKEENVENNYTNTTNL